MTMIWVQINLLDGGAHFDWGNYDAPKLGEGGAQASSQENDQSKSEYDFQACRHCLLKRRFHF